jgi:hypothetical protein
MIPRAPPMLLGLSLNRFTAMYGAAGYQELLPDHRDLDKDGAKTGVTNRGDLSPVDEGIGPRLSPGGDQK